MGPKLVSVLVSSGEGNDTMSLMEFGFDAAAGQSSNEMDTALGLIW